jgi:excisionase family DNA binding protein
MKNKFEHDFLTQKECSEYLGVNFHTIYNWISQGRITVYKLGRNNRFKKSDLDKMFLLKK